MTWRKAPWLLGLREAKKTYWKEPYNAQNLFFWLKTAKA
jgi:hypothetical protein